MSLWIYIQDAVPLVIECHPLHGGFLVTYFSIDPFGAKIKIDLGPCMQIMRCFRLYFSEIIISMACDDIYLKLWSYRFYSTFHNIN